MEYHLSDSLRFLGNDVFQVDVIDIIPVPYKYVYWAAKLNKFFDQELFKKISKIIILLTKKFQFFIIYIYMNIYKFFIIYIYSYIYKYINYKP